MPISEYMSEIVSNPIYLILIGLVIGLFISQQRWFHRIRYTIHSKDFQELVGAIIIIGCMVLNISAICAFAFLSIIIPVLHIGGGFWAFFGGLSAGVITTLLFQFSWAVWEKDILQVGKPAEAPS